MSQKQLGVVYIVHGFALFGAKRRSLTYKVNKTGPTMDAWVMPSVREMGSERTLPILTTCLRNDR